MNSVDYHAVYILHQRPYTDSKILVELLSQKFGRVSAVFRASKKSRSTGNIAYFRSMEAKWAGKSQLKTLHALELNTNSAPIVLEGKILYCGFYLNELLTRSLPESDESAFEESNIIFHLYEQTLKKLAKLTELKEVEPVLRRFEFILLSTLGFGLEFTHDVNGREIQQNIYYQLNPGEGFSPCEPEPSDGTRLLLRGSTISLIAMGDLDEPETLKSAKWISRIMLPLAIGDKPLKSKELFS